MLDGEDTRTWINLESALREYARGEGSWDAVGRALKARDEYHASVAKRHRVGKKHSWTLIVLLGLSILAAIVTILNDNFDRAMLFVILGGIVMVQMDIEDLRLDA